MKRGTVVAIGAIVGWYAIALAILHPLANAPVADAWIYGESARLFRTTGVIRFPGYTETMPVAQVIYGAAWGSLFGASPASLDLANTFLAVIGAVLMYSLATTCGARRWQALTAAGLLMCNPCYLYLSFSFMSEISFLAALLGSHLAFAKAEGNNKIPYLWVSATLAVVAFAVRPFGGAAILGCLGAMILYDGIRVPRSRAVLAQLAPFGLALIGCALFWFWLTVWRTPPWKLVENTKLIAHVFEVAATDYLRMGIIGPVIYLGIVLSPLALVRIASKDTVQSLALSGGIFIATVLLAHTGNPYPATPEMSCFGGWSNALILRGMPNRFEWHDGWRYAVALLGSIGGAGLVFAAIDVIPKLTRASAAVLITAAIYWAAMLPLWFFNDRYFLVLVPAAALILALAPMPENFVAKAATFAMTAAMGLMSLGGTYSYQRGLAAIVTARDMLMRRGIARASIDAGYELNGMDLYRYPARGHESEPDAADVPMVTSSEVAEYTIAMQPFAGSQVVGTIPYPGPFGLGTRTMYLLHRTH